MQIQEASKERNGWEEAEIYQVIYFSYLYSMNYFASTGIAISQYLFTAQDILLLRRLVDEHPDLYLDEMAEWLQFITGRNTPITVSLIERTLQRIGISRLKVSTD